MKIKKPKKWHYILPIFFALFWITTLFTPSKKQEDKAEKSIPTPSPFPTITGTVKSKKITKKPQTTVTPTPKINSVLVTKVIDGDTIEIETGDKIRYIGINTPEIHHPKEPQQCFGQEAASKNEDLVLNKQINLEKDVSGKDRYGRLLRYVWLDGLLINEELVRQGYAHSSTFPPNVKYQKRILEAEKEARRENRGLWGVCNTPTPSPVTQKPSSKSTNFTCNCSKNCGEMSSCEEAYFQLNNCGCSKRDRDKDGIPCETICQ